MDVSHLKNTEMERKRVVLRGEVVKDDSGSHAVFPSRDLPRHT